MRVAAVQYDIAWEDKAANHRTIEAMLDAEGIEPDTYVLLPELGDTGFSMNLDRIVDDRSQNWAAAQAKGRGIFIQHGFARRYATEAAGEARAPGKPDMAPGPAGRNCAAIFSPDGKLLGEYQKVHPFSFGKESQYYGGGDHLLLRRCGEAVVCPLICYDLRFPELWRLAARAGAEVFFLGASWPAQRLHHWRVLVIARAIENQAYVVALNRCGSDPHLHYAGGSLIVAPTGDVLREAGDAPFVLEAELDLRELTQWRADFPALRDSRPALLGSTKLDVSI